MYSISSGYAPASPVAAASRTSRPAPDPINIRTDIDSIAEYKDKISECLMIEENVQ